MKAAQLPPHLAGVIWAYDEDARALVCLLTGVGFSLRWLPGWNLRHEDLRGALPPIATRTLQPAPQQRRPLVRPGGQPLALRHTGGAPR